MAADEKATTVTGRRLLGLVVTVALAIIKRKFGHMNASNVTLDLSMCNGATNTKTPDMNRQNTRTHVD